MRHLKNSVLIPAVLILLFVPVLLLADKSTVKISTERSAVKGSEIVIKIKVIHDANNFFHHTEWAYVKVNGREIARWKYPFENEVFTREIKYRVDGPLSIEAMAYCNLHGSAGPKTATVKVK